MLGEEVNLIEEEVKEEDDLEIIQVHPDLSDRTWTVSVNIDSKSPITKLFSPSHELDKLASSDYN